MTIGLVTVAFVAPLITPYQAATQDLLHRLAPPSSLHWLGSDELGRDIAARLTRPSCPGPAAGWPALVP